MGRSADYTRQRCAIAASLHFIGEPWTLLILRDAFRGVTRFEQWQESLGMARNVLAARLKSLVAHGILEARIYCERPRRHEYVLSERGQDIEPVLFHLADWGARHIYGEDKPLLEMVHHGCGQVMTPVIHCSVCDRRLGRDAVTLRENLAAPTLAEVFHGEG